MMMTKENDFHHCTFQVITALFKISPHVLCNTARLSKPCLV